MILKTLIFALALVAFILGILSLASGGRFLSRPTTKEIIWSWGLLLIGLGTLTWVVFWYG